MVPPMAATAARSTIVPSSSNHTTDPLLQPFLQESFDPAAYLNSTLPTLSTTSRVIAANYVPLPELISQTQSLLNQLSAHTTRLGNVLTQFIDEIVRSGGRLAYEVEVLKGEVTGLGDVFEGSVRDDIGLFLPAASTTGTNGQEGGQDKEVNGGIKTDTVSEPEELQRLRTLTLIRSRLAAVAQTFDKAMSWPLAPSDLQQAQGSSLISISAPEAADPAAREEKGKQAAEKLQKEVLDLVGDGRDLESLELATERVRELRELVGLWKGTMEEKARTKFVEGLEKAVDDGSRKGGNGPSTRRGADGSGDRGIDYRYGSTGGIDGGYGFFSNLRNLSKDVYID
ncbi:hypothetical protein K431DRAFT_317414 [Polychaeton citri CBS 116435]|uniref:Uncharacterized protein n=1 Tax=Polychaeton citri CBS 116435 TaxID=1314669 RepID=A0A9P4UUQ6_9PEZI|nr:hypothetical protein K431DRAFT_317414 [Polychaeton citri CBS 116435]